MKARSLLRPLAEQAPTAASVRELLGLTYYRLRPLEAGGDRAWASPAPSGSTEQNPVLADRYRVLGRHARRRALEELRAASPGAALVAEGRIVHAGSLAHQGRPPDAIVVLGARPSARPSDPRSTTCGSPTPPADLYERAGDVPRARQLFGIVAAADPELADVEARG